jgi:hypothetical protein
MLNISFQVQSKNISVSTAQRDYASNKQHI